MDKTNGERLQAACKLRREIINECVYALTRNPSFLKAHIIENLDIDLDPLSDFICCDTWESVRKIVEEESGCKLLPMSADFTGDKVWEFVSEDAPPIESWLAKNRGAVVKGYVDSEFIETVPQVRGSFRPKRR